MRSGLNPTFNIRLKRDYFHRVIIPVHIPELLGYFKDSLKILDLCITSLLRTCDRSTAISIVNNNSCDAVVDYLNNLLQNKKIDQLLHNTQNLGKVNAIYQILPFISEKLVTITDADVLFKNGWQEECYSVFKNVKNAGCVCPTPSSKSYNNLTYNIYWDYFFSSKLKFRPVKDQEGLRMSASSVGNKDFYQAPHFDQQLTLKLDDKEYVVGAGHFIAMYNTSLFKKVNFKETQMITSSSNDHNYLDLPVVISGAYRLSTQEHFAYHLGNVYESWMKESIDNVMDKEFDLEPFKLNNLSPRFYSYYLKQKVFQKILRPFKSNFYSYKGLKKEYFSNY